MDKKRFFDVIMEGLVGTWVLQYDTPTQWLEFSKIENEGEVGKLIMANSADLTLNRQRVEYEVLITDDLLKVFINIYVKTSNQTIQYVLNHLNSPIGNLWLDSSDGKYSHYQKIDLHS